MKIYNPSLSKYTAIFKMDSQQGPTV